jgi:hypothetical protein
MDLKANIHVPAASRTGKSGGFAKQIDAYLIKRFHSTCLLQQYTGILAGCLPQKLVFSLMIP